MRKALFIILLVSILFISGCGKTTDIADGPFTGGTNGVAISFADGSPISEFASNREVPVKVVLTNNGEYEIPPNSVKIALYGLAMNDYGLSSDYVTLSQSLLGLKKGLIEEGAQASADMGTLKYQRDLGNVQFIEPTLRARVCYPYKTEASVSACISSREIEESGGESVCTVGSDRIGYSDDEKSPGSTRVSSSPIQVTGFSEELEGIDKVKFKVDVENKGLGEVYMNDMDCAQIDDPIIKLEKKDMIYFSISPLDVKCFSYDGVESNQGYLKLNTGKKSLICTMPVEVAGSSYLREITIFLDYKYTESTSKQLKILKA